MAVRCNRWHDNTHRERRLYRCCRDEYRTCAVLVFAVLYYCSSSGACVLFSSSHGSCCLMPNLSTPRATTREQNKTHERFSRALSLGTPNVPHVKPKPFAHADLCGACHTLGSSVAGASLLIVVWWCCTQKIAVEYVCRLLI